MSYMKNIWKLYAIRFFHHLIPAYVIERLFWEQRGMTIQMVVYTEIIYAITVVLLEIPTGIIADKWSRKKLLLVNAFLSCCEMLILIFAHDFKQFALAIFLAGVGRSAGSGSENALLYDSLLLSGKAGFFEKCLGRLKAFDISAAILAALSGSILANLRGFEFNYWLSLTSMFISLCLTFTLVEPYIKRKPNKQTAVKEYVKASFSFFKKNPNVCFVLLSGMVTGSALNFIDEFWQLYINRLGIPVVFFGLISALMSLLRLPGNLLAYTLKSRFSYKSIISGVTLTFSLGFLYLSAVKGYSSLAVLSLICVVSGVIEPIAAGYLHHRIDSSMRATIDSFQSLGLRAILIVTGLGFGFFSSKYDVSGGYGFISLICGAFLVYFKITFKERNE